MNLKALEVFVAVAEELHFRKAAVRLHTTQPSVSAWIRTLETEVGSDLLERNRRGVRLTEAGAVFLGYARSALRQSSEGISRARRAARGEVGRLRLGYTPLASYAGMPGLVRLFRRSYPDAVVELTQLLSAELEEALAAEIVDIALLHPPLNTENDLEVLEFAPEELVLALPASSPLAELTEVPIGALEGQPVIGWPRTVGPYLYDRLILTFRQAGFGPKIVQEVSSMEVLIGLAASGIGCGFVARSLSVIQRPGVAYRPLVGSDLPTVPIALVWRRGDVPPIAARLRDVASRDDGGPWRCR